MYWLQADLLILFSFFVVVVPISFYIFHHFEGEKYHLHVMCGSAFAYKVSDFLNDQGKRMHYILQFCNQNVSIKKIKTRQVMGEQLLLLFYLGAFSRTIS